MGTFSLFFISLAFIFLIFISLYIPQKSIIEPVIDDQSRSLGMNFWDEQTNQFRIKRYTDSGKYYVIGSLHKQWFKASDIGRRVIDGKERYCYGSNVFETPEAAEEAIIEFIEHRYNYHLAAKEFKDFSKDVDGSLIINNLEKIRLQKMLEHCESELRRLNA